MIHWIAENLKSRKLPGKMELLFLNGFSLDAGQQTDSTHQSSSAGHSTVGALSTLQGPVTHPRP